VAECRNHPGAPAANRCTACAEPFCSNCLVQIDGRSYCSSCKVTAVRQAPVVEQGTMPCKEASEALTYAIVGLFCFGIILEPIALVKAGKARKMLAMNPRLTGHGKATAATIIAVVGLVLWVLGLVARFSEIPT